MKTEQRIPSRLFLVAGKEIESALQRATSEAFHEFGWQGAPIASWEDGKVVIVSRSEAWANRTVNARGSDDTKERLEAKRDEMFLELVLRIAQKIYIMDEELRMEFASKEAEFCIFLTSPDNADVLRNACRTMTGREMTVRVVFVDLPHDPRRYLRMPHEDYLYYRQLWEILYRIGDSQLAKRVEALWRKRDSEVGQNINPPTIPRVPKLPPAKGDDLTSHKGE